MRIVVGVLLAFLALNAVAGGAYGMLGAHAWPLSWLEGGPFHSFFVPSLILCVIVGGASALAAAATFKEHIFWRPLAYLAAVIALGFVVIEMLLIGYVSWMQPAVIAYAVVIGALTWAAPLRPRRSHLDHLASSSARSA